MSARVFVASWALLLLAIAACGSQGPFEGTPRERESAELTSPASPTPATACPGASTLKGVDVSEFEAGYDFAAGKAAGSAFAFIRVSDGTGHPDASFDTFYPQVKAAGLVRGVYQYFEPSQDPVAQADLLLAKIGHKLEPGDLPPIIDLEAAGATGAQAKAWLDHVEAALGVKPMIYVGYYFWTGDMGDPGGFGGYPLWIAGYVTCPDIPAQWSRWTFWQYSDGTVNGTGGVDLDLFNGTLADLTALTAGGATAGADYAGKVVSQTYPLAGKGAVAVPLGHTVKGAITVQNVGRQTWKAGVTKLAPMPRDKPCAVQATSWLSPTRVSTIAADVPPGAQATFEWDIAGNTVGDFDEYYGFVEEGVTWFADAPQGGGPSDTQIELRSHVAADDGGAGDGGVRPGRVKMRGEVKTRAPQGGPRGMAPWLRTEPPDGHPDRPRPAAPSPGSGEEGTEGRSLRWPSSSCGSRGGEPVTEPGVRPDAPPVATIVAGGRRARKREDRPPRAEPPLASDPGRRRRARARPCSRPRAVLPRDRRRVTSSLMGAGRLLVALVALATLEGCGGREVRLLQEWTFVGPDGVPSPVTLPSHVDAILAPVPAHYFLRTRVALGPSERGRALLLVAPRPLAHVSLEVDGSRSPRWSPRIRAATGREGRTSGPSQARRRSTESWTSSWTFRTPGPRAPGSTSRRGSRPSRGVTGGSRSYRRSMR